MKSSLYKFAILYVVFLQVLLAGCSTPQFAMFETEKKNITSAVLITDVLAVEDIIGDTDRVVVQENQKFADIMAKSVSKMLEAKGYPITKIYAPQIGYFSKPNAFRIAAKPIDREQDESLPTKAPPFTPDTLLLSKDDPVVISVNQYLDRPTSIDETDARATLPLNGNINAVFFIQLFGNDISFGQQVGKSILTGLISGLVSGLFTGRVQVNSRYETSQMRISVAVIDQNTKKLLYRTSRLTQSYSEAALNELLEWFDENFPSVQSRTAK